MSGNEFKQFSSGGVTPFLAKTYELVDNPSTDDIICWTQDGTSFVVLRTDLLEKELLPLKFKHSKFASFQRQLNQYSFRKTDPDSYTFTHQFFQKGRKDLLKNIQRKQNNHSGIRSLNQNHVQNNLSQNYAQNLPNGGQIYFVESQGNLPLQNCQINNNNSSENNSQDYSLVQQQLEGLKKDKQLMTYEMDKMLLTQKSQQDVIQGLQKQVQKQDEILRSVVLFLSQGLRNPSIVQQFMMGGMGQKNQLVDQFQNADNTKQNGFNNKKRRIEEGEDSEQSVEPVSNAQKSNQIIQYDPHYYDVFQCMSQMWEQHNQQHEQNLYLEKQQQPENQSSNHLIWDPHKQEQQKQQLLLENQKNYEKSKSQIEEFQEQETNQTENLQTQEDQINRQMSSLMIDANREISWGIPVLTSLPIYHQNNMHALQNMQQQQQQQQQYNMHALQNPHQQQMPAASYSTQSPGVYVHEASGLVPTALHELRKLQDSEQVHVKHAEGANKVHAVHVPHATPFLLQQSTTNAAHNISMPVQQQNQSYFSNYYQLQQQQQQQNSLIAGNDISFMDNDDLSLDIGVYEEAQSVEKEVAEKQVDREKKTEMEQQLVFGDFSDQNILDLLDFEKDPFQSQDSLGLNFPPQFESQGLSLS